MQHVRLVDPEAQLLKVFRLEGEALRHVASHLGDVHVRTAPFDAIELDVGALWWW